MASIAHEGGDLQPSEFMPPLIAISVVTFGLGTPIAQEVFKKLQAWGIPRAEVHDLRTVLRDPRDNASRALWQVDGTHEWTQRAVYGQESFPTCVQQRIGELEARVRDGRPRIIFEACHTGFHRADVFGRTLKSCLNRKLAFDPAGEMLRVFNCMHFPLCELKPRDVAKHLELAWKWADTDGWALVRGGTGPREDLYAYDACCTRPQAYEHFHVIYDNVESYASLLAPAGTSCDIPFLADDPDVAPAGPADDADTPDRAHPAEVKSKARPKGKGIAMPRLDKGKDTDKTKSEPEEKEPQAKKRPKTQAASSSTPAATSTLVAALLAASNSQRAAPPAASSPPRFAPPPRTRSPSVAPPIGSRSPSVAPPIGSRAPPVKLTPRPPSHPPPTVLSRGLRSKYTEAAPSWQSFDRNVRQWREFLEEAQCDVASIQELFLLSQHSKHGYEIAVGILHKFMKKQIDKQTIRNPSAFLHVCCKNSFEYFSKYNPENPCDDA
jgi:hypothetical protein